MDRRDFLKTLGLALSALALPKPLVRRPAIEPCRALETHSLQDCVPVTDEWLEDGAFVQYTTPGPRDHGEWIAFDPPELDEYGRPATLMGFPIEYVDSFDTVLLCPRCNVTLEDFGPSHVVDGRNYWHCLKCRHSYRDECGVLTDLGREGAIRLGI